MNQDCRYIVGDVLDVLGDLPDDSVDLVLTSPPFLALRSYLPADHPHKALEGGSQATPGEFIDWLLDVTEALARVLAPHGTLAVELGDTYSGSSAQGSDQKGSERYPSGRGMTDLEVVKSGDAWPQAKSLTLVPETYRFALAYGLNPHTGRTTDPWRIRNVIRWVRPNPPVGALGDKFRPATSELVIACKSANRYFDLDAVREPYSEAMQALFKRKRVRNLPDQDANIGSDWTNRDGFEGKDSGGAPPLDWWQISPEHYKGAHYATWPRQLCIKPVAAMCPERVCTTCGQPSRRISDVTGLRGTDILAVDSDNDRAIGLGGERPPMPNITRVTTGWSDCGHDTWRRGTVLDPFAGSGVTLAVAHGHGRSAIGIDLDERNAELARERVGMWLEIEHHNTTNKATA